ncbi:MAG TPA: ROK family transcriptional regulator [Bryobacteraceae bacterium]|nr:ROK family transcriptional regulator [Bryobacteraceae bacterium]
MLASGMRRVNEALLLGIVREKGLVSRAELARLSGLTKPTVSSQVANLIHRGVVREEGAGEPDERGGKPPKLLRFNANGGALIAAEIGSVTIRVWLTDLDGNEIDSEVAASRPELGAAQVLDDTNSAIQAILGRGRGRKQRLFAAAIAAPGRVDANTGAVLEAGNVFHWRDVAVRDYFERALRVPVRVENDVNLSAVGEMHSGLAQGVQNFALIRLGTGIGAALVLGGRLYQGDHWAAGEIGHMIFGRNTAYQEASERGHLELAVGSDRLRARVQSGLALPSGVSLSRWLGEALRRNDPAAAAIIDELAGEISLAVTNLAVVIDPELIVLNGEMFELAFDRIRELVGRVVPWPVRVEQSALGDHAVLLGAASMARSLAHDLICGPVRSDTQTEATRVRLRI